MHHIAPSGFHAFECRLIGVMLCAFAGLGLGCLGLALLQMRLF